MSLQSALSPGSQIGECSGPALSVRRCQATDLVWKPMPVPSWSSCGISPHRRSRAGSTHRSGTVAFIILLGHHVTGGVIRLCPSPSAPVCTAGLSESRRINSILEPYQYKTHPCDACKISSARALCPNWGPIPRLRRLRRCRHFGGHVHLWTLCMLEIVSSC